MKKLIAMLLSMIMIMAMGMTAMAEDTATVTNSVVFDDASTMTFTTDLLMSETAITAPTVDFTYTISTGDIVGTTGTETVTAPEITTIGFSPASDSVDPASSDVQTLSKDVTVDFSGVTWPTTGIYHYTITATDRSSVSGVVMDTDDTREIYVYVLEDETTTGSYYIENIIMTTTVLEDTTVENSEANVTEGGTKSSGFLNGYGIDPDIDPDDSDDPDDQDPDDQDPDDSNPDAAYEDFLVTLNVEGNMADRDKDFTIAITSTEGIEDGMIFTVQKSSGDIFYIQWDESNSKFVEVTYSGTTWTEGSDFTAFALKDGETFTVYSVVAGMGFKTTITDEDNYTIYSCQDAEDKSTDEVLALNNRITQDGTNESNNYTPTYAQVIPETGVILELLPFVLIVLFAGALITFRVAKSSRRRAR